MDQMMTDIVGTASRSLLTTKKETEYKKLAIKPLPFSKIFENTQYEENIPKIPINAEVVAKAIASIWNNSKSGIWR